MDILRAVGAVAVGAGLMYVLDPQSGRRRRALVRDQLVHAAHKTGDAVDTTSRDLTNRARGVVAELRGRFEGGETSDVKLAERVRARVGAVVGHGSAIQVEVNRGRVTLSGPVLADEVDRLLRRIRAIRGVRDIEDRLEVHAEPANVPGLQGRPRPPRGGEVFELWQENWSPTARLFTGLAGVYLLATGLRRLDLLGLAVAGAGMALLTRASTNVPLENVAEAARGWQSGER